MDFVGLSTRLAGRVAASAGGEMRIDTAHGPVRAPGALPVGTPVTVGVRPELIRPEAGENALEMTLADAMVLGARTQLHGQAEAPDRLLCEVPGIHAGHERGARVTLGWSVADTLVYEAQA